MSTRLNPPPAMAADPGEALRLAAACLTDGRLQEAEQLCRLALRAAPADAEALALLGGLLGATGRFAEARESLARAIAARPLDFAAHVNYAHVLSELGDPEGALRSYARALELRPDVAEIYFGRANALRSLGRRTEALRDYECALALRPDYAEALNNHGTTLQELGRDEEALASFERALATGAGDADAWHRRGNVLHDLRRYREALDSQDQALRLRPGFAAAWANRAAALSELQRFEEAVASCERALELAPDNPVALSNRGVALHALLRFEEALKSHDATLLLAPELAAVHINRATTLNELQRYEEALASCARALELNPRNAAAHYSRGALHYGRQRLQEAVASYDAAIALDPDFAAAYQARGYARLMAGDFERGWIDHEWRWKNFQGVQSRGRLELPRPMWRGEEPLAGRRIFLHFEAGLGDTLQFCRYAPLVAEHGAEVILGVQPALKALLASLPGVETLVTPSEPLPEFDLHCALMSLPLAFGTTLDTVPARVPYLRADARRIAAWRERLGAPRGLRVGLVWSGGYRPNAPELWSANERRNIPLAQLAPLRCADVEFYSLQKGAAAEAELTALRAGGWSGPQLIDTSSQLEDFADTAALIEHLDLVISVDTSTAHLAGALGRPVWLMNRFDSCWRWLLERTDSPWYPTCTLYRQAAPGRWDDVVDRIREDLVRRATAWRAGRA